jgi:hypothetical protein
MGLDFKPFVSRVSNNTPPFPAAQAYRRPTGVKSLLGPSLFLGLNKLNRDSTVKVEKAKPVPSSNLLLCAILQQKATCPRCPLPLHAGSAWKPV